MAGAKRSPNGIKSAEVYAGLGRALTAKSAKRIETSPAGGEREAEGGFTAPEVYEGEVRHLSRALSISRHGRAEGLRGSSPRELERRSRRGFDAGKAIP